MVVHYRKIEEAEYFQGLMEGKKYFFERDIVEDEKGPLHVFGVRIGDFNEVNNWLISCLLGNLDEGHTRVLAQFSCS